MMTGTPHFEDSLSATIRGTTSNNGPGGTGTTILIVRLGNSSAAVEPLAVAARQAAAPRQVTSEGRNRAFMDCHLPLVETDTSSPLVGIVLLSLCPVMG